MPLKSLSTMKKQSPNKATYILQDVRDTPTTAKRIATELIPTWKHQADFLLPKIKGKTLLEICRNLHQFCRKNFKYKLDPAGKELIRSPKQSWIDRKIGIDCEDYSIIIASVLLLKGYRPSLRITDYGSDWQHIYVVCEGIVIDAVEPSFNNEAIYKRKMDFVVGGGLSGIVSEKEAIIQKYAEKSARSIVKENIEYAKEMNIQYNENELYEKALKQTVNAFPKIAEKFESGDVDSFEGYLMPYNPNSRAMYEELFGVKLPKTQLEVKAYLKKVYSRYYEQKDKEYSEKVRAENQEKQRLKEKERQDNPLINYSSLNALQKGKIDKILDEKFNWGSEIGIKTHRQLLNEGFFDSKHFYEVEINKKKDSIWDADKYGTKIIYQLKVKDKNLYFRVPKLLFDAVDFSKINNPKIKLISLRPKLEKL